MSHPKNDIVYESPHLNPSNHAFISKSTFLRKLTFFEGGDLNEIKIDPFNSIFNQKIINFNRIF